MTQDGYDAMADLYAATFATTYQFPIEAHAVAAFTEMARGRSGVTVDVGCGLGHVTADLVSRGLDAIGCDPSAGMLKHARRGYPHLHFIEADATLAGCPGDLQIAAIIARFSLIHVEPVQVADVLGRWSDRVAEGTPVLVAFQVSDEPGPAVPFDHAVAPAWRWHPDEFGRIFRDHGFNEDWRILYRDNSYRYPMAQLVASRG